MTARRRRHRPLAALLAVVVAALTAALALASCGSSSSAQTYAVAAIFDNASFVTPDVDVRIAGARVGKVADLSVTPEHKARVLMEIDAKYGPFHTDADCTIQPQSLISERFINCTPGSSDARDVADDRSGTPTLGVEGTHSPVDIDQVLNTFDLSTRERLTLLLDGLGVGLAARGEDLNAAIRRAAPALQATHQTLSILDADRTQLRRLITDSDTVLKSLAAGRGRVADFVRQAGVVAETTGKRRKNLAAAVRDLPALLAQARPSLDRLGTFAGVGTPFAQDLRRAAPGLRSLVTQLAPFSDQATPTLVRLGQSARSTTAALPDIAPQVRRLRRFATAARPAGALVAELMSSFRARGTIEGVQGFVYYAAAAIARFDKNSHYLPAYLLASPCTVYARTPTPGCDAHFAASREGIKGTATTRQKSSRRSGGTDKSKTKTTAAPLAVVPAAPGPPAPPRPLAPVLKDVVPKALGNLLQGLGDKGRDGAAPSPSSPPAKGLLEYLFG